MSKLNRRKVLIGAVVATAGASAFAIDSEDIVNRKVARYRSAVAELERAFTNLWGEEMRIEVDEFAGDERAFVHFWARRA